MRSLFIALLLAWHFLAGAEILAEINFSETLRMIKDRYRNANFEDIKTAWLQKDEKFIKITGIGLGKTIFVMLDGLRETTKSDILHDHENLDDESKIIFAKINNLAEDDVYFVRFVRIAPDQISTLEKYKSVYGKPECNINKEMQSECNWRNKSLSAKISDDGKYVLTLETYFTNDEKAIGISSLNSFYSKKNGLVSLQAEIRNIELAKKKWASTFQRFISDISSEIDYNNDKAKNSDLDYFLKLLANRTENSNRSMEWFLSEAHKMVKQKHGIN